MTTKSNSPFVTEPERRIAWAGGSDVLVAGAGPAGISAALAAARAGADVRLIETHGCLGGIWTAGLLAWMFEMNQPGIPREITERLDQAGAKIGNAPDRYTYDIEAMKLLLEEMCAEAGVRFQLHTRAAGVLKKNGRLTHVITESKSGREAWHAENVVDATGDGDLAALAGCGFSLGRNSTNECQPMTFMALISVRNAEALSSCISFWNNGDMKSHLKASGNFLEEIRRAGTEPSYTRPTLFQVRGNLLALMVNHEYNVSAIDTSEITAATVNGRSEVNRVLKGLRGLGGRWEGTQLVATCEQIGVREGRRIHGRYTVSREDLAEGRRHEDAVCRVSFGVDIHCTNPSEGKGQEKSPIRMRPYDIPLRALLSRDIPNLLLAGRCISGDFFAHSSYRVTGSAAATGQAAGIAAAISAESKTAPSDLEWSEVEKKLSATTGSEWQKIT